MDLRLKFIGVNESDVIATSCSYAGGGDSYLCTVGGPYYYFDGFKSGPHGNYEYLYCTDTEGTPTDGKFYHLYKLGDKWYFVECDDDTHHLKD